MTSNGISTIEGRPTLYARVTAFVLLVLVTMGAVAAAAHTHGNVTSRQLSYAADSAIGDAGDSRTSSKKQSNGGECLVCQLHQHLHSGLLGALQYETPPVAQLAVATQNQDRVHSHSFAPRRGRAPPLTSLV